MYTVYRKSPHCFYFTVVCINIGQFLLRLAHSILKKFATQQLLICLLHLHTVATLPWEKLVCGFGTILANLLRENTVESTSKLEDLI